MGRVRCYNVGQKPKALRAVGTHGIRDENIVRERRREEEVGGGIFETRSSLKLRRSGARRGVGHELSFARAKVPAREKPVARERSKKRRPRKECANDITLFVLSRNRFPFSFFWRIGERGSAG